MENDERQNIESENFFNVGNDFFSLKGYRCFCGVDIINIAPNKVEKRLKIQAAKDSEIHYAFSGTNGLCRTTPMGSVCANNLLGELISLPNNDIDSLMKFFENNGFLFPLKDDEYEEVDVFSLTEVVNHIKATVLLMSELAEPQTKYDKILYLTLYLLLSQQVTFSISSLSRPYSTCRHGFIKVLEKASSLPEIDGRKEALESDSYSVVDTVYRPRYALSIDEYQDIISGSSLEKQIPGMGDSRFKDIVYLYRNAPNEASACRTTIDFLFHLMKGVGVVDSVSYENGIEFYAEPKMDSFDDKMKHSLISVAKIVLNEEINSNLSGIQPRFNVGKMEPSWRAANLLSALYFSIFYMRPGSEIYRECANPACHNRFLVKTTNSRKKYCCGGCRNATAQRNHRKKVKGK